MVYVFTRGAGAGGRKVAIEIGISKELRETETRFERKNKEEAAASIFVKFCVQFVPPARPFMYIYPQLLQLRNFR